MVLMVAIFSAGVVSGYFLGVAALARDMDRIARKVRGSHGGRRTGFGDGSD